MTGIGPTLSTRLVAGIREPAYPRNSLALGALSKRGGTVVRAMSNRRRYLSRFAETFLLLLQARREHENVNLVYLTFLGQPIVPIVRILFRAPIVLDAFISIYDTLVFDRKVLSPHSAAAHLLLRLEGWLYRLCEIVLVDTESHRQYFATEFSLPLHKIRVWRMAADPIFEREKVDHSTEPVSRHVFYYSSNLAVHGLNVVLQAAQRLANEGIVFRIAGLDRRQVRDPPTNVDFLGWVPYEQLPRLIDEADLCLGGHFSNTPKARRVIAGKTFQFVAMGKPVVLTDLPGNREVFSESSAIFCKPHSPPSLASAILQAFAHWPKTLAVAAEGHDLYRRNFSATKAEDHLCDILINLPVADVP